MARNKSYFRQIILSIFLSVLILLVLGYVTVRFVVPTYAITQNDIYQILVRLFPIVIGLVMIEVGVSIARRNERDDADNVDLLPPNAYDKPLYKLPGDDPLEKSTTPSAAAMPVSEIEKPSVEEKVEVQPDLTVNPEPIVIREEVEKVVEKVVEKEAEKVEFTFDSILELELQNAIDEDYDLSLMLLREKDEFYDSDYQNIKDAFSQEGYSFLLEDNSIAVILPFFNIEEAKELSNERIEKLSEQISGMTITAVFSSKEHRAIDSKQLYHEAFEQFSPSEAQ